MTCLPFVKEAIDREGMRMADTEEEEEEEDTPSLPSSSQDALTCDVGVKKELETEEEVNAWLKDR